MAEFGVLDKVDEDVLGAYCEEGIAPAATGAVTLSGSFTTTGLAPGDRITDSYGNIYFEVVSITSASAMVVRNLRSGQVSGSILPLVKQSERPDGLFADIMVDRDITDLRHKTYLVAPSYEQLLIDGTDQILRGASQVERKELCEKPM